MLLTLFYGLVKGGREIVKKKAIEKSKNYSIDVIIKQWEEKFKQ